MRYRFLLPALVLCLLLAACGGKAPATSSDPPPAEGPSGSSLPQQVVLPDPAYAQASGDSQGEPIPPELLAGLSREEADFLTEEQWAVYDEGFDRSRCFLIDPGYFGPADSQIPRSPASNLPGREGYCRYPGMIYSSFTDLYRDMRTVYTEELFQRLNTAPLFHKDDPPDRPVYRDFDDALYYLDFTGGADITLLPDLTRFELTSQEEDRVVFDQIAYYCDPEDVGRDAERPAPVRLCRCPVTLVREEGGWRMADFVPIYHPTAM